MGMQSSNGLQGHKIVENIFFTVTCVSVFTCIIRSDYNFAMGLLCYYMIKNANEKIGKIAGTLILLNVMTIAMDVLWIVVMRSVWDGKPTKNATSWKAFDNMRSLTIILSLVNVALKAGAVFFLSPIHRAGRGSNKQ